jgi:mono/diheme cytochrome c family protein
LLRKLSAAAGGVAAVLMLAACGTGGPVSEAGADVNHGRQLFSGAGQCAGCHTLAAAGSTATIGPNLDAAFAQARAEGFKESAILDIVHDQIKFPGQYPTRQSNQDYLQANMPANLVKGQDAIDVAAFVAANAGKQGFVQPVAVSGTNGKQIFTAKCGGCHTLKAAGTNGTVGPNLDALKPPFATVKKQVIHGGVVMPAFKGILTDAQITAVAKYVASHAGK